MTKEIKTKLVAEIINQIPFLGLKLKEEIVNQIIAIDSMDKEKQEAFIIAEKEKETKELETKIAEAQKVLAEGLPKLEALKK